MDGLREFTCTKCGHTVVVNPKLPPGYTPTVCTPCYDNIVIPEHRRTMTAIWHDLREMLDKAGLPLS